MTRVALPYTCSNRVLLTGAGFTHNFGGLLAKDMWAEIFNNRRLQENTQLRKLLLDQFDFESAYFDVMTKAEWAESDKKILTDAVCRAYEGLDEVVCSWSFQKDATHPVNDYELRKLISRFGEAGQPGFFFTLNQDLFMERMYVGNEKPMRPGVTSNPHWFKDHHHKSPLTIDDLSQLPTQEKLEEEKGALFTESNFFYIKLHGSHDWTDSEGNRRMVIGRDKDNQINREPLLREYLSAFKNVLCQGQCHLLVIGYGFGDNHINCIIADAAKEKDLKLYVLSPTSIADFSESMITGNKRTIYDSLAGYFPYDLLTLFPADQSDTPYIRNLNEQFFG